MVKKTSGLDDIFKRTEPQRAGSADLSDLDEGNIRASGVGLREGEIAALDAIGQQLGDYLDAGKIARNALMRIAIRNMIIAFRNGAISLDDLAAYFETPEKPQPRLKL